MPDTALYVLRAATGSRLGAELAELVLAYAPVSADDERDFCAATSGEWHKLNNPIEYASRTNNLLLLKQALPRSLSNGENIARSIAHGGSLGLLRWAAEVGHSLKFAAVGAAHSGCIPMLRWLYEVRRKESRMDDQNLLDLLLSVAVSKGHTAAAEWLHARATGRDFSACAAAAGRGDLRMLQWLLERGHPWDGGATEAAALNGHMDLLRWAISAGLKCDWVECSNGFQCFIRHAEDPVFFEWAEQHTATAWCDSDICETAAQQGRSDILAWALPRIDLRDYIPFRADAELNLCTELARNGYLSEFQEAHSEHRCGPDFRGERCCGKAMLRLAVRRAAILQRAANQGMRLSRPGVRGLACQGKLFRWARKKRAAPAEALEWVAAHPYPRRAEEWAELRRLVEVYASRHSAES